MGWFKIPSRKRKPKRSISSQALSNPLQPHKAADDQAVDDQATTNLNPDPAVSSLDVKKNPYGVRVWHECPDATVDICFIHGLTVNRETTWTAHGQSAPWPKTLLPPELPKARILTYGYDAYVVRAWVASENRLADHATNLLSDLIGNREKCKALSRPLIFVAHSLGGLICKETMLLSRNNPEKELCSIFDYTKGLIFMGTPHQGSSMSRWGKIPVSGLGFINPTSVNKALLDVLETKDQYLQSIQFKFLTMVRQQREAGRQLEVKCFFEEEPMPMVGKVVEKESATFSDYVQIGIPANHSNMIKFVSEDEIGFVRVLAVLSRWASDVGKATWRQSPTRHSLSDAKR